MMQSLFRLYQVYTLPAHTIYTLKPSIFHDHFTSLLGNAPSICPAKTASRIQTAARSHQIWRKP